MLRISSIHQFIAEQYLESQSNTLKKYIMICIVRISIAICRCAALVAESCRLPTTAFQ